MLCNFCQKETTNPKYCSSSCAAKQNNKKPKRKRTSIWFCTLCSVEVNRKNKYCKSCNPYSRDWNTITYGEILGNHRFNKNNRIRQIARRIFNNSDRPKKCFICGYDKHIEICHVKQISSFPDDTKVSVINDISNLVALCPNHHWELDNNLINLNLTELGLVGIEPTTSGL